MNAKEAWEQFAAYAETGDVDGIHIMLSSMTEDEVKSCMNHGATLMRSRLSRETSRQEAPTHGGFVFPAAA